MAKYDKKYDRRDQESAEWFSKNSGYYSGHSDKHLQNALRFAKGCAGSEAKIRQQMIRKEISRRSR